MIVESSAYSVAYNCLLLANAYKHCTCSLRIVTLPLLAGLFRGHGVVAKGNGSLVRIVTLYYNILMAREKSWVWAKALYLLQTEQTLSLLNSLSLFRPPSFVYLRVIVYLPAVLRAGEQCYTLFTHYCTNLPECSVI